MSKRGFYLLTLLLLSLLLANCSRNQAVEEATPKITTRISYPYIEVPAWICYPPEGEVSIGLAWNSKINPLESDNSAREFAAVSLSRNHSSYVVDKSAIISYAEQTELSSASAKFDVVVSADTSYLNWADKNIQKLAETSFVAYKAGIYSPDQLKLNTDVISVGLANLPPWTKHREIYEEDGVLYIPGYANAISLIEAWQQAQENALKRLGQYRLMNVIASLRSTDDWTRKMTILETVTQSPNARLNKAWFFQKKIETTSNYGAYILLKVEK